MTATDRPMQSTSANVRKILLYRAPLALALLTSSPGHRLRQRDDSFQGPHPRAVPARAALVPVQAG
jgi:hypothetical protein